MADSFFFCMTHKNGGSFIWIFRTLGHNLTDTVVTRKNAAMVTSGPLPPRPESAIYGDHACGAGCYLDSVLVASDCSGCLRVRSARVADAKRFVHGS
jgi:hypothetical protein